MVSPRPIPIDYLDAEAMIDSVNEILK